MADAPRRAVPQFRRIPTVMRSQEIVDSAFRRASRISMPEPDGFRRVKATETARLRSVQNSMAATLQGYVRRFPSFDQLPPFYADLIAILVDLDATRKALGAVDWAAARVNEIADAAVIEVKSAANGPEAHDARSAAYGRIASVIGRIDPHLALLDDVRRSLRNLPTIDPALPTIVVAGYPNVGKSTLVRAVSTGKPEVANYPFTTKGVVVGHFEKNHIRHQIVDTPGLLDRDLSERNDIELQGINALRHLADVIIFLVDPSGHCGYPADAQMRLLEGTRAMFHETPIIVAESKADLGTLGLGETTVSVETGAGVENLLALALARMRKRPVE